VDPEKKDSETNKLLLEIKKEQEEKEEKQKQDEKKLEQIEDSSLTEDFKFTYRMPNISLKQDDILKLTAQYVAINGEDFLIALTERKRHDPLFNFLKPSNSKFNYFTRMVDSYVKIIGFGPNEYKKLQQTVSDKR
jgi:hypothetical protein